MNTSWNPPNSRHAFKTVQPSSVWMSLRDQQKWSQCEVENQLLNSNMPLLMVLAKVLCSVSKLVVLFRPGLGSLLTQWAEKKKQQQKNSAKRIKGNQVLTKISVHLMHFAFVCRLGTVAQLVKHRTGTLPTQIRFPVAARDFSPRVNFQCRLSFGVRTPPCTIACIYICTHVKDPVVHIRVRWIMETLKHTACTVGWVARLCRSWLSPEKATRISNRRNPIGTVQL